MTTNEQPPQFIQDKIIENYEKEREVFAGKTAVSAWIIVIVMFFAFVCGALFGDRVGFWRGEIQEMSSSLKKIVELRAEYEDKMVDVENRLLKTEKDIKAVDAEADVKIWNWKPLTNK